MIKTLTDIFERMFSSKQPQLTSECIPETYKETPTQRKPVDLTPLTPAQQSLVLDAVLANNKARVKGYGKTDKALAKEFNALFKVNKSEATWGRIFKRLQAKQTVGE